MPHRSHLKQQNKPFKKVKRTKNKVRNKEIEKSGKKKKFKKLKDILNGRQQSYREKAKGLKLERQEKAKHVPYYDTLNICILSFHESVDILSFKKDLIKYLYLENEDDIDIETIQLYNIYTIHFNEKKKNKCLTIYDIPRTVYGIIDGTKCADIVLCLFKDASLENSCFDKIGYELLSILKSQGVPSIIGVSYKNESTNIKNSQSFVSRYFHSEFTEKDKLVFINEKKDFFKLYNEIWNTKVKNLCYREARGYMLVDSCGHNSEQNLIYLKGFVKGVGLNTVNPIHITNIGDYYVKDIFVLDIQVNRTDVASIKKKKPKKKYITNNAKEIVAGNTNGYISECGNEYTNRFTNESTNIDIYRNSLICFLNQNKSSSTSFQISYEPIHVQSGKKEKHFEVDNDFTCIRPVDIMNLNEQNHFTNLMTLKNKNKREKRKYSKKKYSDSSKEYNTENGTENETESVENDCSENMNEEVSEARNNSTCKYKANFNLNIFRNDENVFNKQNNESYNNIFDSTNQKTENKWTFIAEEKHEYNEDIICSFGRNEENLNKNTMGNIPNTGYETNIFENCKYEKNENKDIGSYSNDNNYENKKNNTSEFFDKIESESETGDELSDNRNEIKSTDAIEDECFELDSVHSGQVYLNPNISAKERFKKYRSLVSFLNTHIDVYEELPLEYSRIYDYESYHNLTKYARNKYLQDCNFIGNQFSLTDTYCVLVIANDTDNILLNMIQNKSPDIPLMISSLLPFERKVTVLNMKVKKNSYYEDKVFSKEQLEVVCGFRHFLSRPIFSEQYVKAVQSRALYERYLKNGENKVASIYGFTTATRSSVFLLKETVNTINDNTNTANSYIDHNNHMQINKICNINEVNEKNISSCKEDFNKITLNQINSFKYEGSQSLETPLSLTSPLSRTVQHLLKPAVVAMGKVMNCDCKRIIMKRISITGKPYKIHKKKVVVRGMFHNPKDINYFKPVELQTRLGLSGKILESLGTHGKMKCVFNNVLKAHDIIFMNLYKRVFPKWFPLSWNDMRNYGPDENTSEKIQSMYIC